MKKQKKSKALVAGRIPVDVRSLAAQYRLAEDLVQQVAYLLEHAGRGLPSFVRFYQQASAQGISVTEAQERWNFLDELRKWNVFRHMLADLRRKPLLKVLEELLALLVEAKAAQYKSWCAMCKTAPCAFGEAVKQGTLTMKEKPSDQCPRFLSQQTMQSTGGALAGLRFLKLLLHPVNAGALAGESGESGLLLGISAEGSSDGDAPFDATFSGTDVMPRLTQVVKSLTEAQLAVFQLARNIEDKLPKGKLGKTTTVEVTRSSKIDRPETLTEASRNPALLAMPKQLAGYKIATKSTVVVRSQKPEEKKQLFHVLLDSTGSMTSPVAANTGGFFHRGHLATAMMLAVVRKCWEEGGKLYLRFFAGQPSELHSAENRMELVNLTRKIGLGDYSGSETNINNALCAAFRDIQGAEAHQPLAKAEVLLITDGTERVDEDAMRRLKGKVKLNVLECCSDTEDHTGTSVLKKLAEHWEQVNSKNLSFDTLAKLV